MSRFAFAGRNTACRPGVFVVGGVSSLTGLDSSPYGSPALTGRLFLCVPSMYDSLELRPPLRGGCKNLKLDVRLPIATLAGTAR
jgi:hypothetical protein